MINIISGIIVLMAVILAVFNDDSVVTLFFLKILVPIIPVIFYLYTTNQELNKDLDRLEKLKMLITNTSELVSSKSISGEALYHQILLIQSEIYDHRKNGMLVLDFIYNRLKQHQEQAAKDYARQIISNRKI